ncbi:MAG: isochorismatase family protein [Anaerolineales bacterium]|nr:isochorismatase family protein [Anaerolineales bacterium]
MSETISNDSPIMRLPIRTYRIGRLYGPGMPPSCEEGYFEEILEKPVGHFGIVSVHCWNLGEADGPYPIEPDSHVPGEVADWVPTAHEVIEDKIKPVLTAARNAGVAIFHLAQDVYAPRYPRYLEIARDPELRPTIEPEPFEGCVRPWTIDDIFRNQYGPDFPGPVWITHVEKFDIAQSVRPLPNEDVVLDGWQLNGLCRRKDIDTLIYVGFMADLCLMNIPGAMREMVNKYRYRCIVLKDCTTAYEYEDTYTERVMNRAAVRLMETDLGSSSTATEFIQALEQVK